MADEERTREELEAENAELKRKLENYQRAERMRVEMESARPQRHPDAWMLM